MNRRWLRGSILAVSLTFVSVYGYLFVGERNRDVIVLMYHRIVESEEDAERYALPVDRFREQLVYLDDSGYTITTLAALSANQSGAVPLPPKPIVITFDDGTADHYRMAYPVLKDRGDTAAFFPVTSWVTNSGGLSFEQLREMAAWGMTIGSHTVTHPYNPSLRELQDDQVIFELGESKRVLEDSLGQPVEFVAVPGGWYDERTPEIARSLGYRWVLTSNVGRNPRLIPGMTLRRLEVDGRYDIAEFARAMRPSIVAMHTLFWRGRKLAYAVIGPETYANLGPKVRSLFPVTLGTLVVGVAMVGLVGYIVRRRGVTPKVHRKL